MSGDVVMIGRESGNVYQYAMPRCTLEAKHNIMCRPYKIALNCDASRLAIIDLDGRICVELMMWLME